MTRKALVAIITTLIGLFPIFSMTGNAKDQALVDLPIGTYILPDGYYPFKIRLNSDSTGMIWGQNGSSSGIWKYVDGTTKFYLNRPIIDPSGTYEKTVATLTQVSFAPSGGKWKMECGIQVKTEGQPAESRADDCSTSSVLEYSTLKMYLPEPGILHAVSLNGDGRIVAEFLEGGEVYTAKDSRLNPGNLSWSIKPSGFEIAADKTSIRYLTFGNAENFKHLFMEVTTKGVQSVEVGIAGRANPEFVYSEDNESQFLGKFQENDYDKVYELSEDFCQETFTPPELPRYQYACRSTMQTGIFTIERFRKRNPDSYPTPVRTQAELWQCVLGKLDCYPYMIRKMKVLDDRPSGLLCWTEITYEYVVGGDYWATYSEIRFLTRKD